MMLRESAIRDARGRLHGDGGIIRRCICTLLILLLALQLDAIATTATETTSRVGGMRERVWKQRRDNDNTQLGVTSADEGVSWWQRVKIFFHWGTPHVESASGSKGLRNSRSQVGLRSTAAQPEPRYNESTAIYLAYVTSVAYCQESHIMNWSCSPCALVDPLDGIHVVEDAKDNFQGIVGYSKAQHAVTVAFRGSMDITNWIDNLTFVKKKAYAQFPDVRVHEGFYWVFQSVAAQLVPAVRSLLQTHAGAAIVVTGHSLGGAVAALCGFELALIEKLPVQAIYTFGEPRVGNSNFSSLLNQAVPEIYRLTHYRDVVPHLPPTWIGFQHETREVFYDEYASSYRICDPHDGEDPLCSDVCSPFGCTSVVDHLTYLNVTMSHLIC